MRATRWTGATPTVLRGALSRFASARVALEVGTNSAWVSRLAARHGHEVIVANPRRVRLIAENDSKSDRFDAELLALGYEGGQGVHP